MSNFYSNQLELFEFIKSIGSQINLPTHLSEFINLNLSHKSSENFNIPNHNNEVYESFTTNEDSIPCNLSPISITEPISPSTSTSTNISNFSKHSELNSKLKFSTTLNHSDSSNNINVKRKNQFKGVFKCGKKFKAQIQANGIQHYLGLYNTPEEAAKAYDKFAREMLGARARTNFKLDEINEHNKHKEKEGIMKKEILDEISIEIEKEYETKLVPTFSYPQGENKEREERKDNEVENDKSIKSLLNDENVKFKKIKNEKDYDEIKEDSTLKNNYSNLYCTSLSNSSIFNQIQISQKHPYSSNSNPLIHPYSYTSLNFPVSNSCASFSTGFNVPIANRFHFNSIPNDNANENFLLLLANIASNQPLNTKNTSSSSQKLSNTFPLYNISSSSINPFDPNSVPKNGFIFDYYNQSLNSITSNNQYSNLFNLLNLEKNCSNSDTYNSLNPVSISVTSNNSYIFLNLLNNLIFLILKNTKKFNGFFMLDKDDQLYIGNSYDNNSNNIAYFSFKGTEHDLKIEKEMKEGKLEKNKIISLNGELILNLFYIDNEIDKIIDKYNKIYKETCFSLTNSNNNSSLTFLNKDFLLNFIKEHHLISLKIDLCFELISEKKYKVLGNALKFIQYDEQSLSSFTTPLPTTSYSIIYYGFYDSRSNQLELSSELMKN